MGKPLATHTEASTKLITAHQAHHCDDHPRSQSRDFFSLTKHRDRLPSAGVARSGEKWPWSVSGCFPPPRIVGTERGRECGGAWRAGRPSSAQARPVPGLELAWVGGPRSAGPEGVRPPADGWAGQLHAGTGWRCCCTSAATTSASARCLLRLVAGSARTPVEPTSPAKIDFGSPPRRPDAFSASIRDCCRLFCFAHSFWCVRERCTFPTAPLPQYPPPDITSAPGP